MKNFCLTRSNNAWCSSLQGLQRSKSGIALASGRRKRELFSYFRTFAFMFPQSIIPQYIISVTIFPLTFFSCLQLTWIQLQWILLGKTKALPHNLSERRQILFYQSCKVSSWRRCKPGRVNSSVSLYRPDGERRGMRDSHGFCSWQQLEKCELGQFSLVSAFRKIWLFLIHPCPISKKILVAPLQESIICFSVCSAFITLLPREGRKQQTNFFHSFSTVFSPRVSFGIQGAICFVT